MDLKVFAIIVLFACMFIQLHIFFIRINKIEEDIIFILRSHLRMCEHLKKTMEINELD